MRAHLPFRSSQLLSFACHVNWFPHTLDQPLHQSRHWAPTVRSTRYSYSNFKFRPCQLDQPLPPNRSSTSYLSLVLCSLITNLINHLARNPPGVSHLNPVCFERATLAFKFLGWARLTFPRGLSSLVRDANSSFSTSRTSGDTWSSWLSLFRARWRTFYTIEWAGLWFRATDLRKFLVLLARLA